MNTLDYSEKEPSAIARILWNGALVLFVVLLGLWIGRSVSAENLLSPPVLLALGLPLVIAGPYLAHGFVRTLTAFEYPLPLGVLIPLAALYLGVQATFQELERVLMWGEIFALLLLPAVGRVQYRHPGQRQIVHMVYFMLFLLPAYGLLYTLLYWTDHYQTYFLLRHLAVFHYIVFFFAAYNHADKFIAVFARFYWAPFLFIIPGLLRIPILSYPYWSFGLIGVPVLLAWCYLGYLHRCRSARAALFGLLSYMVVVALLSLRSTNVVAIAALTALLPAVRFFRCWHQFVPRAARGLVSSATILLVLVAGVYTLHLVGKELQENIVHQIDIIKIPEQTGVDLRRVQDSSQLGSMMYRLALWAQFFDRFAEHPLGIGIGTPAFDQSLIKAMALGTNLGPDLEYQTYTVGAHNSFFTFLARFGVVFLIPFAVCAFVSGRMISGYLRACNYSPLFMPESRVAFGATVVFLVAVIEAAFNMVVETPLYAALFWFSFGLMVRLVGDYPTAPAGSK